MERLEALSDGEDRADGKAGKAGEAWETRRVNSRTMPYGLSVGSKLLTLALPPFNNSS
ncbi:hypothetical protein [Coleofasciculus sp. G2-EDA-02]|uniref:hypothetical protein n=1 Tax=Coleofasciculus sp. G2-EDA-02 TaxID=3069529 RepID=UPI0032FD5837